MRTVALLMLWLSASGCASTFGHSLHVYGFTSLEPAPGSTAVEVVETESVVLGFIFDTDYVDRARDALLASCKGGALRNVQVKFSTDMGFLAYTQKVRMSGDCVGEGEQGRSRPEASLIN